MQFAHHEGDFDGSHGHDEEVGNRGAGQDLDQDRFAANEGQALCIALRSGTRSSRSDDPLGAGSSIAQKLAALPGRSARWR